MASGEPAAIRDQLRAMKKERILAEATRLFYENGFRGTSLEAIADTMQVTKPFVYGVYDKKTEILFDISLRNSQQSLEAVRAGSALDASPRERLAEAARRLTRVCIDNREAVAVSFREETSLEPSHHDTLTALKREIDNVLAAMLEDGVASGDFHVIDARTSALAIGGMISWTYVWYRPHGRLSAEVVMEHMAAYAIRVAGGNA